ncbi:hypothetical protein LCGC14_0979830 [marine sediment metagenome]|uniref:Uncharacterized protein n=1 Tax=marine sediment metagenome TaxID=412755 RepID=A0A0F9NVC9_9ZZZZ
MKVKFYTTPRLPRTELKKILGLSLSPKGFYIGICGVAFSFNRLEDWSHGGDDLSWLDGEPWLDGFNVSFTVPWRWWCWQFQRRSERKSEPVRLELG